MSKFAFFIIFLNLFIFLFFACESENDDRQLPQINIENTSFSDGDTFYISSGATNHFQVDISDNDALATMKIKIRYAGTATDSFEYHKNMAGEDSAVFSVALMSRSYTYNLLGLKNIVLNDSFQIINTFRYRPATNPIAENFPVKAGKWYDMVLGCIDRAGNYDSIVYKNITILYKDSVIPESAQLFNH